MTDIPQLPAHILDGIDWVWFDLDDTLYDFRANSHTSLAETYRIASLHRWWPSVDEWRDHYHRINDELWELYAPGLISRQQLRHDRFFRPLTEAGCPDWLAEALYPRLDHVYLDLLAHKSGTVPGAIGIVDSLRRHGLRIGILSNGFKQVQYGKLSSTGLMPIVDCVVLSDEIDINKPDPRIFDFACRKAGTSPDRCLMIGDNPSTDIIGAINARWKALWFNPDMDPEPEALSNFPRPVPQIHSLIP